MEMDDVNVAVELSYIRFLSQKPAPTEMDDGMDDVNDVFEFK